MYTLYNRKKNRALLALQTFGFLLIVTNCNNRYESNRSKMKVE